MDAPAPILFDDLVQVLRSRGFNVGIEEQVRLHDLFEHLPYPFAPSQLASLICPVVAKTREEQLRFYAIFEDLFPAIAGAGPGGPSMAAGAPQIQEPTPTSALPRRSTGRWLAAATTVAAGVALWLVIPRLATEAITVQEPDAGATTEVAVPQAAAADPEPPTALPPPPQASEQAPESEQSAPEVVPLIPLPEGLQWLLLAAPFLGLVVLQWWSRRRRRAVLEAHRSKGPPLTWRAFDSPGPVSPYEDGAVRSAAQALRRREEGEVQRLDVPASIDATIANCGHPSFRYHTPLRAPDYVALIQRSSRNDHQAALFDALLRDLEQEELPVTRLFFGDHPRMCYHDPSRPLEALEDVYARHSSSRLLVFGSGHEFLHPVTGSLDPWTETAVGWDRRALLTPTPVSSWGAREVELAKHFVVVPATADGLRAIVELFGAEASGSLADWDASAAPARTPYGALDEAALDDLAEQLGAACFRWLCACAVYPDLQWDLTLRLGQLAAVGTDLVTEENVLRLIRLPWFRQGHIPDETRLGLVSRLDPETESAIRAEIVQTLEENLAPEESIAGEEHRLHIATQRALAFWQDRRKRRAALRKLADFPPELLARDGVSARLLARRRSLLGVQLPEALRQALYRGGNPMYGWRTATQLGATAMISLVVLAALPRTILPPAELPSVAEALPPEPPETDCEVFGPSYNADGSCFDEPPTPLEATLVPLPTDFGDPAPPSTLALRVGAAGDLLDAQLAASSGDAAFDALAQQFASSIAYSPALKDGAPVEAWAEVPFSALLDQGVTSVVTAGPGGAQTGTAGSLASVAPPQPIALARPGVELIPSESVRLASLVQDSTVAERIVWTSADSTVASIGPDGLSVVGRRVGSTTLRGMTPSERAATLRVEVVAGSMYARPAEIRIPIGAASTIEAMVDASDRALDPTQLRFASSDPAIASVTDRGEVTAHAEGTASVEVAGPLGTRRIPVTVHRRALVMAADPDPSLGVLRVPLAGGVYLTARLADLDLVQVPEAPIEWVVGDSSVMRLEQAPGVGQETHTVVGAASGSTTLEARGGSTGNLIKRWQVEVTATPPAFDADWIALDLDQSYGPVVGFRLEDQVTGTPFGLRRTVADTSVARWVDDRVVGRDWGSTVAWIDHAGGRDSLVVHVVPMGRYEVVGTLRGSSPRIPPNSTGIRGGSEGPVEQQVRQTVDFTVSDGSLRVTASVSCSRAVPLDVRTISLDCRNRTNARTDLDITFRLADGRTMNASGRGTRSVSYTVERPTGECEVTVIDPDTGITECRRYMTQTDRASVNVNTTGSLDIRKLASGGPVASTTGNE